MGSDQGHKNYKAKTADGKEEFPEGGILVKEGVSRINDDYSQGERHQHAELERARQYVAYHMENGCKSHYERQMLRAVFGVGTALGYHVCKDGKCYSAEADHIVRIGREGQSYMPHKHCHHCDNFKLIARKSELEFRIRSVHIIVPFRIWYTLL